MKKTKVEIPNVMLRAATKRLHEYEEIIEGSAGVEGPVFAKVNPCNMCMAGLKFIEKSTNPKYKDLSACDICPFNNCYGRRGVKSRQPPHCRRLSLRYYKNRLEFLLRKLEEHGLEYK